MEIKTWLVESDDSVFKKRRDAHLLSIQPAFARASASLRTAESPRCCFDLERPTHRVKGNARGLEAGSEISTFCSVADCSGLATAKIR